MICCIALPLNDFLRGAGVSVNDSKSHCPKAQRYICVNWNQILQNK